MKSKITYEYVTMHFDFPAGNPNSRKFTTLLNGERLLELTDCEKEIKKEYPEARIFRIEIEQTKVETFEYNL